MKPGQIRRCYLGAVFFLAAMAAATLSCQPSTQVRKEMTVEEASRVAMKFQGKYQSPPPRGFGDRVQAYVDQYRKLAPGVLEKCSQPRRSMTQKEIRDLRGMKRGSHLLRRAAEEAFMDGSLEAAIHLCNSVIGATWKSSHKAKAMAYKAFFLAQGGDPDAAQLALNSARGHYDNYRRGGSGGENDWWAEVLRFEMARAEGAAAMAGGDPVKAEMKYYQALDHFDRAHALSPIADWELPEDRKAMVKAELAKTMRMQGRLNEAEIWAREAVLGDDYRVKPMALLSLAEIYSMRREFDMARQLALAARNLTIDRCVSVESLLRAKTRALHAQTLMALEQWQAGLAEFEMIEKEMASDPEAFARSYRDNADWGLAMIMAGKPDSAIVQLRRAGRRAARRYGNGHYHTLEAEALMGVALAALKRTEAAKRQLDQTAPRLLSLWRDAVADNTGGAFRKIKLRLIMETYIDLLTEDADPRGIEKAFAVAGELQARSVSHSLSASAARSAVNDPDLAALIRQRQDLEMQTNVFQARLAQEIQTRESAVLEKWRGAIAEIDGARAALDEEILMRFPRYSAIINPGALNVSDLREHLKPGEAVIVFFVGAQRTFVWAFEPSGPVAFASVPMGRRVLAGAIGHLRKALDPKSIRQLSDIPDFDIKAGYALYRCLLEPVAHGWQNARSLMVIPDGPMGQLPLAVLPAADVPLPRAGDVPFANHRAIPWLARSHAVTLLPSVSSLVTLRTLPGDTPGRRALAAFADPVFSRKQAAARRLMESERLASRGALHRRIIRVAEDTPLDDEKLCQVNLSMLQPLPDTAIEAMGIAEALGADSDTDVFLGERASEGTLWEMPLNDRRVLVFATHGLVPGDLDGLREPALALSAPGVTGEKNSDGLLTMGEVMGLSLDADWVVLSACNTAAGSGAGAEAVSGLGQAFFYAGARSLLVTGWPVETTSARLLTTDLFRRQKKHPEIGRAQALKETMNAIMDTTGDEGFSYAHPLFWAPYMLVGS